MKTRVDYGQLIKIKENRRAIRKERRIISGSRIWRYLYNTTNIESFNGILRERAGSWPEEQKETHAFQRHRAYPVPLEFYGSSIQKG